MKIVIKNLLIVSLLTSFSSCKEVKKEELIKYRSSKIDNLGNFSSLVPLEIIDSTSQNVYEKFGIEFTGNCYACDLAKIKINKKNFDFVNVCEKNDFYRIEDFTYTPTDSGINVLTDKNQFIFTRIGNSPVYKLRINGDKMLLKNKRISTYFTQEKNLKKFEEYDCGDFDG